MTAEAALVGALRDTAAQLSSLAERLDTVRLAHVDSPRLLILSAGMLTALADVEREAVRLVAFAPYADTASRPQGREL